MVLFKLLLLVPYIKVLKFLLSSNCDGFKSVIIYHIYTLYEFHTLLFMHIVGAFKTPVDMREF